MLKFLRQYNKFLLAGFGSILLLTWLVPSAVTEFARHSGAANATWATLADGQKVKARPVFDLVLLGIGSDGHLLSCFPESAAFDAPTWAVGVPAPTHIAPRVPRVTLNPAIVPAARAILAMATGEGKATILAELFAGPRTPRRLPAQLEIGRAHV